MSEQESPLPGWRGGGIFASRGTTLRLKDFRLSLNRDQTEIVDSGFRTQLRIEMWAEWLFAAQERCAAAVAARAEAISAGPEDEFNAALVREFHASLQAICAVGFLTSI